MVRWLGILSVLRRGLLPRVRQSAACCVLLLVMWGAVPATGALESPDTLTETPLQAEAGPRLTALAENVSPWLVLEEGLELARFPAEKPDGRRFEIVLLRISPDSFDFVIHSAAEEGERPASLKEWADRHDLVAAINAGMYLPDGITNTGYLRVGKCLNNPRIVGAFGAFFLTAPDKPHLPGVQLLDRAEDAWEALLPRYAMAVQNYRFISSGRRLLWQPGGPEHSIAAVGRDGEGRILLIHAREPLAGVHLGRLLLELPVDVRLVMYVEGGSQAGLLLRTPRFAHIWMGQYRANFRVSGNSDAPLPNVIGVKRKNGRTER